ncbi:MAG: hypothetical protein OEM24_07310 [Paracoccaceae bacterium]|nr:hypothetical protein [Paracoccaceae bacterium]
MRFVKKVGVAAVAAAFFVGIGPAAIAEAEEISRQVPVDAEFGEGSVRWNGLPGGYFFKARVIAVDGRLEVCGVGAFTDAYTRSQETAVLRETKLTMNGQPILEDLSFFARVNRRRELDSATANCRRTSASVPRDEATFGIDVPSKRFRF